MLRDPVLPCYNDGGVGARRSGDDDNNDDDDEDDDDGDNYDGQRYKVILRANMIL